LKFKCWRIKGRKENNMKYKWQDSFSARLKSCPKLLIERVFDRLNDGTLYNDVDGKFMGYITVIQGPMDRIQIISDHSLDSKDNRFIRIRITYLDKFVLYLQIDDDHLSVYEFENGWWANEI